MNIIQEQMALVDDMPAAREFFRQQLNDLKSGMVYFRGRKEARPFRHGLIKSCDGDVVIFLDNIDVDVAYPIWDVMVAKCYP